MIENIRKYTGLMIVVLVLLFVGLVFLDGGVSKAFTGKPAMEVDGQAISEQEFSRQMALMQLPVTLPNSGLPRDTQLLAAHYLGDTFINSRFPKTAATITGMMARYLQPSEEEPQRFIANRLNVQKAGLKYGVTPSSEEVETFVENVLFADPEGNYDQETYSEFIKNSVGRIGGNRGFNEYIRDLLTAQNLAKLLGGGIAPEVETIRALYDSEKQTISGQQIALNASDYEAKVNPTEEELIAFYEENKENYKSEQRRKVTYVQIEPDWAKALKDSQDAKKAAQDAAKQRAEDAVKKAEETRKKAEEAAAKANAEAESQKTEAEAETETEVPTEAPDDEPANDPADPSSTEPAGDQGEEGEAGEQGEKPAEAQSADPTTPVTPAGGIAIPADSTTPKTAPATVTSPKPAVSKPTKTPKEQLTTSERLAAVNALSQEVDDFHQTILDQYGKDFAKTAEAKGYEVKQSDFFTKANPPKEFTASVQGSANKVGDMAFLLVADGQLDERTSVAPIRTTDGWFIMQLDEVENSVPLSFEEAKEQVTRDLKSKMARELMVKEAKELHEKLLAAVDEGKDFIETAKELGHTPTEMKDVAGGQVFEFQGQSSRIPDSPAFIAAKAVNPGQIAEVQFVPDEDQANRALIIKVEKRELEKNPAYLSGLDRRYQSITDNMRGIVFSNWLYDQYLESNVVPPNVQQ